MPRPCGRPRRWRKNPRGRKSAKRRSSAKTWLIEVKTKRFNLGGATRLKVGKIPLYVGGSERFSYEDKVATGEGDLYLSNKRIVFLSPKRSVSIALKDVIGLDGALDSITVHSGKRDKPVSFMVRNPALWSLLAKLGAAGKLASPNLPDGVTYHATETGTPGEVNFSAQQTSIAASYGP